MGNETHPSPTARRGNIPTNAVSKGLHKDTGPFSAFKEVWCQQCGFRCNLARDARNVDIFAGETIGKGFTVSDHDYDDGHTDDHDYDGSGRTTLNLSAELTNGSFEDWTAGSPDNWTVSGTVTQETASGYYDWRDDGSSSVKITRAGSDISLSQVVSTPSDFNSNFVIFRVRVKSTVNEIIRLRLDINSNTYYSSYNTAGQRFQDLLITAQAPETVTSLTVYIQSDLQDGTAYVDSAVLARNGNPTAVSVQTGCPHCSSHNYSNRPKPL